MKASELRAVRHMVLALADTAAALLELIDDAMPDEPGAEPQNGIPKQVSDAADELEDDRRYLGEGQRRRDAQGAGAVPTGTDEAKASD